MAKVFVAMYNFARHGRNYTVMPPFYEAFVTGLKTHGNDVLCYFFKEYNKNFNTQMPEDLLNKMRAFDADLYILFNYNFWDVTKYFDKPVLIFDVDSPMLYGNKEALLNNPAHYKVICLQETNVSAVHEMFGIPEENILFVHSFTEIRNDKSVVPEKNIVFVGANWTWNGCQFVRDFVQQNITEEERIAAKLVYEEFMRNPFVSSETIYTRLGMDVNKKLPISYDKEITGRISGVRRMDYLNEIADLGLELHGTYWDQENIRYFPLLALSYNKKEIFSLEENQELYNSAKIGFNVSHIQAVSGFSWRVCDIMASNACIVTEEKESFRQLFPGLKIPTYTSKYEARILCQKLLDSEEERLEIVSECNKIIEENFRFVHILEKLESFMKMNLHGCSEGTLQFIHDGEAVKNEKTVGVVEVPKEENREKIHLFDRAIRKTHHLMGKYLKKRGAI